MNWYGRWASDLFQIKQDKRVLFTKPNQRCRGLTGMLLYQPFQRVQPLHTRLPPDHLAPLEQKHGRDTPSLVLVSGSLCVVDVDFQHTHFVANPFAELFQNGSLLFTGTAPVSVEIYEYRGVAVDQVVK